MMRAADTASYLRSLRDTVANELRPELASDHAKDLADNALLLLNRMVTELELGAEDNQPRVDIWSRLDAELAASPGASRTAEPAHVAASESALENTLAEIQNSLARNPGLPFSPALYPAGNAETSWFHRATSAALDLLESYEGRLSMPRPGANARDMPTAEQIARQLSSYLSTRFPSLSADSVVDLRLVAGGKAKRTAIVELKENPILPRRAVLRSDMVAGQTGTTVADEFPLLTELQAAGLPVPKPFLVERDTSWLGGTFMVMEEIREATVAGDPFPEERRLRTPNLRLSPEFGRQIAAFLARLHRVPSGSAKDTSKSISTHEEVAQAYDRWRSLDRPARSIGIELGFAWLLSHPLPDDRPRGLVHGDFGCHNILVRGDDIASVLDWELARVDDPAADFGDSRRMLLDELMPWDDFVRHYVAAGGSPQACERQAVDYFSVWRFVKHGSMTAFLRQLFLSGARNDILSAGASWHFFCRLQQYGVRELNEISSRRCPSR